MRDIVLHDKVYRVTDEAQGYAENGLFRKLDEAEETQFIMWAKAQPQGIQVNPTWHPSVQNELLLSGRGVEAKDGDH